MFSSKFAQFARSLSRCTLAQSIPRLSLQRVSRIHASCSLGSVEQVSKAEAFEELVTRTRRPIARKRRPVTAAACKVVREPTVVAISIAETFDLQGIASDPDINKLFNVQHIDEELDNALYLMKKLEYTVNPTELSEIYLFEDGVVVFWNVDATQRVQLLRDLEKFSISPYESRIAYDEQDRMPFTIVEGDSCIKQDRFVLSSRRHSSEYKSLDSILERFAYSQGFAASVKVGVWESLMNDLSEPLSASTKQLKEGIIPWTRKEALTKSGEFAALRHSINLDCNLLNRDFYWERSNIEQFFNQSSRHFTLTRRLNVLNRRLDYCEELVKMVDNMLALRHASTLEWMIIVLIVIEVFFDIFHFADRSPKEVIIVEKEQSC